jgi:ribosomal protein S18 acetylase RimI-like enzyme
MEMRILVRIITFLFIGFVQTFIAVIEVRPAKMDDLDKMIALDYDVSMEFFKPMYEECYRDSIMGQQAEKLLNDEVKSDVDVFKSAIQSNGGQQKLVVAMDAAQCCGLLLSEKISDVTAEIALLLVAKDYRKHGIGKKLIKETFAAFDDINRWEVYPFQRNNDAALSFYERLGFKRVGKGPSDRKNIYGLPYDQLYFEYVLDFAGIQKLLKSN